MTRHPVRGGQDHRRSRAMNASSSSKRNSAATALYDVLIISEFYQSLSVCSGTLLVFIWVINHDENNPDYRRILASPGGAR